MEQSKIGQFMKEMRTEKGLTQAVLAEQLHVSDKTVSKWENGKSMPEPSLMMTLCEILEISVSELLNGQRITPDEYHVKTEETMMKLVKETEQNKKNKYQGLVGGLLLFVILIITAKMITPGSDWLIIYIDVIDLAILLAIDVVILLASGYRKDFMNVFHITQLSKTEIMRCIDSLELLRKGTLFGSLFIFILSIISFLRTLTDPVTLGPKLSMAILGLLYAFMINLLLLIPIYRLKLRQYIEE